jgi:DNA-binding PadR family transcriptional regulator
MNYMKRKLGIWEMSVLALLREAPMHPYQMQRLLRLRHKDEILALKRGSLYHAIARLLQGGFIAIEKTGRVGRRPERTTYRITPAGLAAFLRELRAMVTAPRRESSEFMAAVSFLVHLNPGDACRYLRERAQNLQAEITRRAAGVVAASSRVARINLIESEFLLASLKAELAWVRALEKEIRARKLAWNLKAILRDAAASRDAAGHRGDESR